MYETTLEKRENDGWDKGDHEHGKEVNEDRKEEDKKQRGMIKENERRGTKPNKETMKGKGRVSYH